MYIVALKGFTQWCHKRNNVVTCGAKLAAYMCSLGVRLGVPIIRIGRDVEETEEGLFVETLTNG